MLVNVSRFNDVQREVYKQVEDFLQSFVNSVKAYGGLSRDKRKKKTK